MRYACVTCSFVAEYEMGSSGPFRYDLDVQQQTIDPCPMCGRKLWRILAT